MANNMFRNPFKVHPEKDKPVVVQLDEPPARQTDGDGLNIAVWIGAGCLVLFFIGVLVFLTMMVLNWRYYARWGFSRRF